MFIDEIAELDIAIQTRFLTALQEYQFRKYGEHTDREFNLHLITATIDIQKAISEGRFRDDLYARIGSHVITLPSLKERFNDGDFDVILNTAIQKEEERCKTDIGEKNKEVQIEFHKQAKKLFEEQAKDLQWTKNFRDFHWQYGGVVRKMVNEAQRNLKDDDYNGKTITIVITEEIVKNVLNELWQEEKSANTARITDMQNQDIPANSDNDAKVEKIIKLLLKNNPDDCTVKNTINDLTIIFPSSDWKNWIEIIPIKNNSYNKIGYLDLVKLIYILHLVKDERITKYACVDDLEHILGTSGNLKSHFLCKFRLKVKKKGKLDVKP